MNRSPVNSKIDMYRRLEAGEFGPNFPTWRTRAALTEAAPSGIMVRRSLGKSAVPILEYQSWEVALGDLIEGQYIINPKILTGRGIQGEIWEDVGGLWLEYSTRNDLILRDAFRAERIAVGGMVARGLLKEHLLPASYSDVWELLDLYPGHVIEFSVCSPTACPNHVGRNALIWEVRNY